VKIPTYFGICSTINFELQSKSGFTNKKSLPNGKPFIGEHPSMLQPDSNPWDRNPTQQDKDMVIFPEKTTTDFVYIIFWIISFFLDLFHNLVFLFG
jgi:hypothetical protein